MKVLVIGGGGREHAICRKLRQSPHVTELLCAPGNGGISEIAECVPIAAADIEKIVEFAKSALVDFVVVAPDDPLALGLVDELESAGIPAFGPRKNAAIIESSKIFSKNLMKKYGIPTADFQSFTEIAPAIDFIRAKGAPIVVKADGLALGKGVVVAQTEEEAVSAVREMMEDGRFGKAGASVVIEECLSGTEVTVLAFCDGKTVVPMVSSKDHKRVFDGDKGPNTGGMGAIAPAPLYTPELAEICTERIFKPTIDALNSEGRPFSGVIYFGLMLTAKGPYVIEYNARFGDPEAQAVLELLDTDLFEIFRAVREGKLADTQIKWKSGSAACVVMASGGYPGDYVKGKPISGLDNVPDGVFVFHAGTKSDNGQYTTNGGRVLGVTATGAMLDDALTLAYAGVDAINFENAHFRRDIGRT
ncbi:MAG: phosphoribosylamine--glycine ligase [Oscillospiraceae bacterium]|jgi:phosphoribosylamine--glycine ligase|nr:phosphoribosylamine--glycine ligase [Oscillospiraceae bacterium]